MEGEKRRSKRKPLSNITNTLNNNKPPFKTLIKPSFHFKNPISSPPKSHTSTGSNHSLFSGGTACRNSRVTVDQVQRHETTRKDKGKMVAETPTIPLSASVTNNPLQVSSSASPDHSFHSGTQAVQNQHMHVQVIKDKGKITEDAPAIHSPALFTSKFLDMSSSGCSLSENSPVRQKLDEERRKDKGKMVVETPTIQLSALNTTNTLHISSSASPDHSFHPGTQAVQNQHMHVQVIKDKGKITKDAPAIHSPALFTSKFLDMSSSGCSLSENSPVHQKLDEERRKDKGKMVVETPTIQLSALNTTNTLHISSSTSPDHSFHSGMQAVQNQHMHDKGKITEDAPVIHSPALFTSKFLDMSSSGCSFSENSLVRSQKLHEERRKDKGKMIAETPTIELSASNTTNTLQISSSASPDHSFHSGMQAVQNQDSHVQLTKDKGKITEDAPVIHSPGLFTSKYLHMSSSGYSFSETSPIRSQKLDEERRKSKGKMVLGTPNMEVFELSTPHTPVVSFAASGTIDRPLTEYNRRRPQRGRKHAADKINFPLSCPPDQRSKKTGLELNSDRVNKSGSHTDPLPVRKKKRSRDKYQVHVMPKEEVEKLKTYYADIDAFELPVEEVASENELE